MKTIAEPIQTEEGELRYQPSSDTWELQPPGQKPRSVGAAVALRLLAAAVAMVPAMAHAAYSGPSPTSE